MDDFSILVAAVAARPRLAQSLHIGGPVSAGAKVLSMRSAGDLLHRRGGTGNCEAKSWQEIRDEFQGTWSGPLYSKKLRDVQWMRLN